jgi:hypothetical protein
VNALVPYTYAAQPDAAWRPDPTTGLDRWGMLPHRPHNRPDTCALCSIPTRYAVEHDVSAHVTRDDTRVSGWLLVCPGCLPAALDVMATGCATLAAADPTITRTAVVIRHPWRDDSHPCPIDGDPHPPGPYTRHHDTDHTAAHRLF